MWTRRHRKNSAQVQSSIMGSQGPRLLLILYSVCLTVTSSAYDTRSNFMLTARPASKHVLLPYHASERIRLSPFSPILTDGDVLKVNKPYCSASWRLGKYKVCIDRTVRRQKPVDTTEGRHDYLRKVTSISDVPLASGYLHSKSVDDSLLKKTLQVIGKDRTRVIGRNRKSETGKTEERQKGNRRMPPALLEKTSFRGSVDGGNAGKPTGDEEGSKKRHGKTMVHPQQDIRKKLRSPNEDITGHSDTTDLYDSEEFQEIRRRAESILGVPVRTGLVKFSPVGQSDESTRKVDPSIVKREGTGTTAALSVCPSYNDWLTRDQAQDPYGHRLHVLEMIPFNGTLVRQYFYETICIRRNQSRSSAGSGSIPQVSVLSGTTECLAVDKQVWNSRCTENYIWTYGKVVKENGEIGWSVIAIRGSCSCSVWPKALPGGRRAGPRLFIDDLDE